MLIGELVAKLRADTGQWTSGFQKAHQDLASLTRQTGLSSTLMNNQFGMMARQMTQATSAFRNISTEGMGAFSKISAGATVAVASLTAFAKVSYELAQGMDELKRSEVGLTSLLGANEGMKEFKDLLKFIKDTPFEAGPTMRYAQQLLGAGIAAKDLIPTLDTLGNVVAGFGGGQAQLEGLLYVMKQMKGMGRIMGNDLMQLTNAGIPIGKLAEAMGMTSKQFYAMKEAGTLTYESIMVGMEKLSANMGPVMEKLNDTVSGAMSVLKDTVKVALYENFQGGYEAVVNGIKNAGVALGAWTNAHATDIKAFFQAWVDGLNWVIEAATDFIKVVGPDIGDVITSAIKIGKELWATYGDIAKLWTGTLVGAFVVVSHAVAELSKFLADHSWIIKGLVGQYLAFKTVGMITNVFDALAVSITRVGTASGFAATRAALLSTALSVATTGLMAGVGIYLLMDGAQQQATKSSREFAASMAGVSSSDGPLAAATKQADAFTVAITNLRSESERRYSGGFLTDVGAFFTAAAEDSAALVSKTVNGLGSALNAGVPIWKLPELEFDSARKDYSGDMKALAGQLYSSYTKAFAEYGIDTESGPNGFSRGAAIKTSLDMLVTLNPTTAKGKEDIALYIKNIQQTFTDMFNESQAKNKLGFEGMKLTTDQISSYKEKAYDASIGDINWAKAIELVNADLRKQSVLGKIVETDIDKLTTAYNSATAAVFATGKAQNDYGQKIQTSQDFFKGLTQSLLDAKGGFLELENAGQQLYTNMDAVGQAMINSGKSAGSVTATFKTMIDNFTQSALKAGYSKIEIDGLIKSMGILGMYNGMSIVVDVNVAAAQAKVDNLISSLLSAKSLGNAVDIANLLSQAKRDLGVISDNASTIAYLDSLATQPLVTLLDKPQTAPKAASGGGGAKKTAAELAAEARANERKLWASMVEIGDAGKNAYLDVLRRQLEGLEKYSDEYMEVWRTIKQITEDSANSVAKTVNDMFSWGQISVDVKNLIEGITTGSKDAIQALNDYAATGDLTGLRNLGLKSDAEKAGITSSDNNITLYDEGAPKERTGSSTFNMTFNEKVDPIAVGAAVTWALGD